MAVISNIIDAFRRFGSFTQKAAIRRQDEQLDGMKIVERRHHVSRSELGSSEFFVATVEPRSETIKPLTELELAPIFENAERIDDFFTAFLAERGDCHFLTSLDCAFGVWRESEDKKGYSSEAVIEIAGAAFGNYCVDNLDMRWIWIDDDLGRAIAVQGRAKNFRGFPFDAIMKRIPTGEYGFFTSIFICLKEASEQNSVAPNAT